MYLVLTFDVESCLGREEITSDLPDTLEILSRYPGIRCTFNVAARSVLIDKGAVQRIPSEGHEVSAHGYRHDMDWATKSKDEQEELIVKAKALLESELCTEVVGWATPRGGAHSADIALLKKHGFRWVRDSSYSNYCQFVPPQVHPDGFVDIPRFGYDETGFMKMGLFQLALQKTVSKDRFLRLKPDWTSTEIFNYLCNMLDYKADIERTYLVMNLHPYRIAQNPELKKAFNDFLSYVSGRTDVKVVRARDFAAGLVKKEIVLHDRSNQVSGTEPETHLTVSERGIPDVALVFNSGPSPYSGTLTIKAGVWKTLLLSVTTRAGLCRLVCDRNRERLPFKTDLSRGQISTEVSLPPHSTSLYTIKRGKLR